MANIEFNIGDYRYEVIREGEVSVRAIDKSKEQYEPIPRMVEHEGVVYTVTDMCSCFHNCQSLVKAPAVPDSVTNMKQCFHACNSLVEVPVIPDSVTNMYGCFLSCVSLVKAPVIPDGVRDVSGCFCRCRFLVEAPAIPNSVTTMYGCFRGCTSLVKAPAIPDSVTNMERCFEDCPSLVKAPAIPDSVTKMFGCFFGCYSLVEEPALRDSVKAQAASMNASFNLFDWFSKQKRHAKRRKFYYDRWVGSQYYDDCIWECALPNGYHLAHGKLPDMEPWDLQNHFIMIDEDGRLIQGCLWKAGRDSPLVPSPRGDVVIWIYDGSVYAWRIRDRECDPINLSDQFNNQRVQDARMQSDGILEVLCENGEIWRYWCDKGLFFVPDKNGWTQGKRDFYGGEEIRFLRNPPEWFILMIRNEDYEAMYANEDVRRICFEPGLETIKAYLLFKTSLEKVVIPAHVQDVEAGAFSDCADLKELVIEGDLSRVANWAEDAFEGCPCEEYYKQLRNAAR